MLSIDIGRRIARLRKEKDVRQAELAKILSVSTQAVSKWESGACYPDIELLPAISDYFKVSLDSLFGLSNDPIKENMDNSYAEHKDYGKGDGQGDVDKKVMGLSERLTYAKKCYNRSIDYYYKAEDECLKIILETEEEKGSEFYKAHEQLIHMYCKAGKERQCIDSYKKRCELENCEWQDYYLLALAYYSSKKYKEAWEVLNEIINQHTCHSDCYLLAGNVCKATDLNDEAMRYYKKAYEADKTSCAPLYSQAYLLEKLNRYEDAANIWKGIVEWIHEHSECENNELDWPLVKIADLSKKIKDK